MLFKHEPNHYVRISSKIVQRVAGIKGFYFDGNGLYETENPTLIKLLSQNFETVETLETTKLRHCKKCDFTCETQGQLLTHYRSHKEGK